MNNEIKNFDNYESTGKVIMRYSNAVKTKEEIDKILKAAGDIYIQSLIKKNSLNC